MRAIRLLCLLALVAFPGLSAFGDRELLTRELGLVGCGLFAALYFGAALLDVAASLRQSSGPGAARQGRLSPVDLLWGALAVWIAVRSTDLLGFFDALRVLCFGSVVLASRSSTLTSRQLVFILRFGSAWGALLALAAIGIPRFSENVNPNTSGAICALYAFFPAALLYTTPKSLERVIAGLCVAGLVAATAFFRARSGILSLSVACVLLLYFTWRRPRPPRRSAVLLLTLALAVAPVVYMVAVNEYLVVDAVRYLGVSSSQVGGKRLDTGRGEVWPRAAAVIRLSPWFGVGARGSGFELTGSYLSAHNSFLNAWLEWGLVGVSMVVGILALTLRKLARSRTRIGCCAAAFLVAFVCRDSFEVALFQNNTAIGLASWVVVALGLARVRPTRSDALVTPLPSEAALETRSTTRQGLPRGVTR